MADIKRIRLPERVHVGGWGKLAWEVFQYQYFDAVIIQAPMPLIPYLGTALAMMLKNFRRPVIFYGEEWQEQTALQWARHCPSGIYALGEDALYLACCTSYSPETGVCSPHARPMGVVEQGAYHFYPHRGPRVSSDPPMVCDAMNRQVGLVRPGYSFTQPGKLLEQSSYFVVVRNRSGMDWLFEDKRDILNRLRRAQIPVVVYGFPPVVKDPQMRRSILRSGVILTGDMTMEASLVKLMWTMARTGSPDGVRLYFSLNFAGETALQNPSLTPW